MRRGLAARSQQTLSEYLSPLNTHPISQIDLWVRNAVCLKFAINPIFEAKPLPILTALPDSVVSVMS